MALRGTRRRRDPLTKRTLFAEDAPFMPGVHAIAVSDGSSRGTSATRWWYLAALVAIAIGLILRAWQFGARASIWVDEAALGLNIVDRSFLGLFSSPLDDGQYAPPGFLALVKLCVVAFGASEWSLRLVPFTAGVLSVPFFYLLATRTLGSSGAAVATFLFATATPLILFSSNLKQYAVDVLAVVVVALLTERGLRTSLNRRSAVGLAVAGVVSVAVSTGVVFMLVPAGALLAWSAWRTRSSDRAIRVTVAATWAVAVAAAVLWSSYQTTPVGRAYMDLFWARGFVPGELSRIPSWVWNSLTTEFGGTGGPYSGTLKYVPAAPIVMAFVVGVGWSLRRGVSPEAALLATPIGLALIAAAVRAYPFRGRVILFLIPLLLILTVRGAEIAGRALVRRRGELASLVLVPVAVYALAVNPVPQDQQQMRPVMAYVQSRLQPGDVVWVFYGAGPAFGYYSKMFPIAATVSDCDRANPRSQIVQADRLRGASRAWVIVSHAGDEEATDERTPLISYLDTIGHRLETFPPDLRADTPPTASAAFLFQLDDAQRLASASSASFPVATARRPAWGCYGSMTYDKRRMDQAARAVLAATQR